MSGVRFSTEWIDEAPNASAEERATLCRLRLFAADENACVFVNPASSKVFDHVTVPAVHLAEGLATDWWSIFGGRDREHSIRRYRTGFALPDVRFAFDGSTFEVRGDQFSYDNPKNVRFWRIGNEAVSREVAETTLAAFIENAVERLVGAGVSNSEAGLRWSRVSASLADPDERAFCEAAGALDADPYAISEVDERFIEQAAGLFSGEALIEFLAGAGDARRADLLGWVQSARTRAGEQSCLPELHAAAKRIDAGSLRGSGERSWATGYRAARALRDAMDIPPHERLTSLAGIAGRMGCPTFAPTPGVAGIAALVTRDDEDVRIHVRRRDVGNGDWASQAERFAFARAIGDVVCFRDTQYSVVNGLRSAERQAAGRAFAAEFLAPIDGILDMMNGGCDDDEISGAFHVSPQVIAHQLENGERIRIACAAAGSRTQCV